MNGKFALALILSLQVSLSLCEIPTPSQELVDKYDGLKANFYRRILTALSKAQEALAPIMQQENQEAARGYAAVLHNNPKFQGVVKIATGVAKEAEPLVEKARLATLGGYEAYVRPYLGNYLDECIKNAQYYLNKFLPAQ